ncbi:MAG: Spy/CpxP family protein refolding chaperone [Oxalobacteraceae bacterium]|nr:Spy/CpxP family protein refolding chaperone [Oxalobacteraceae bacterium]
MHKFTKSIIIGITALALGGTALAQIPPSDGAGKTGMMQGKPDNQDRYAQRAERMKEHMARRQADLHAQLKLSPAQEPAWKAYTDSMTPPAMKDRPDRSALQAMPAPQRMQAMLERMQQNQARMETHLAALKTFYATLTPEQQKTFDAEFRHGRGHGRGHHRGGMWK